jgi:hypothetical protein
MDLRWNGDCPHAGNGPFVCVEVVPVENYWSVEMRIQIGE